MDIELTFINESQDENNSDVVIFQKNMAPSATKTVVAWTVIENAGKGWSHKFIYPMNFSVGATDSWGNVSDQFPAMNGQIWNVERSTSGDIIVLDPNPAATSTEVEIKNDLSEGSIDAQIYRDGRLLATQTGVAPQQSAVFGFTPTLWIGVVSQIGQGDIIDPILVADITTEISLLGITKANIVMTGGGVGSTATPFVFTLVPTS